MVIDVEAGVEDLAQRDFAFAGDKFGRVAVGDFGVETRACGDKLLNLLAQPIFIPLELVDSAA